MSAQRWVSLVAAAALAVGLVPLALLSVEAACLSRAPALALAIHHALAPLCHQMAERSPSVDGHALGACWRCVGVDLGLVLAGGLALRGHELGARALAALILAGVGDWVLGQLALAPDLALERAVLGVALGLGLGGAAIACVRPLARAARRGLTPRSFRLGAPRHPVGMR